MRYRVILACMIVLCKWSYPLELHAQSDESLPIIARNENNPQSAEAVEGCASGVFTFFNSGSFFAEKLYTVRWVGTAINGTDYELVNITRVTVPVGRDSVNVTIVPIPDMLDEPNETLLLVATSEGITDTIPLAFKDPPTIEAGRDTFVCENAPLTLNAPGMEDGIAYTWSPALGLSDTAVLNPSFNRQVERDQVFTYTLTGTDKNLCEASDSVSVEVINPPLSSFSSPTNLCVGTEGIFSYVGPAGPNANFEWDFGDDALIVSGMGMGPYSIRWDEPGIKTVCLTVEDNTCTHDAFCVDVRVGDAPDIAIDTIPDQCFVGHSLSFTLSDTATFDQYEWNLGSDANQSVSNDINPQAIAYNTPGVKTVSLIISQDGCTSGDQIQFELAEPPTATFDLVGQSFCQDACIRPVFTGIDRGPSQQYSWDFGSEGIPSTSILEDPLCTTYETSGNQSIKLIVSYKGCTVTDSQNINILDLPIANVDVGSDTSLCANETGITLEAAVSGNFENARYNWFANVADSLAGIDNPQSPNPFVSPNPDKLPQDITYYHYVETQNGCLSNLDSIKVQIKPLPKADAGPDISICENSPGKLLLGRPAADNKAPIPFQYQWAPNIDISDSTAANPLVFPGQDRTYTLRVTSINGCQSIFNPDDTLTTVNVSVQPLPEAIAPSDTALCEGDTLILEANAMGTGNVLRYRWTPVATGYVSDSTALRPAVSPTVTTEYSLIVTENQCDSQADNVVVSVKPRPTVNVGAEQAICLGDSVQLTGIAFSEILPVESFSYQWLPTPNLATPTTRNTFAYPDTTTTYSFQAISQQGCTSVPATTQVIIKPSPIAEILSDTNVVCPNDTLALQASASFPSTPSGSPITFEWSPIEILFDRDRFAQTIDIAPTTPQLYTLTASISGDCPNTDSILIDILSRPDISFPTETLTLCEGDTLLLQPQGDTTDVLFEWSPANLLDNKRMANPILTAMQDTLLQLVTRKDNCTDTTRIPLRITPAPTADFFVSDTSGCASLTVAFLSNGLNADAFVWDFGDGQGVSNQLNPIYTYDNPGTYEVRLTTLGPNGCKTISSPQLIEVSDTITPNIRANPLPPDTLKIPEAEVRFIDGSSNGAQWLWLFGDGNSSTERSPTYAYWTPGIYEVEVVITDINGCSSQIQYGTYVIEPADLFIPNVFTPNEDGVGDRYQILYAGTETVALTIFDRWGKTLFRTTSLEESWDGNYRGERVPEGIYFFQLTVGETHQEGTITLMR